MVKAAVVGSTGYSGQELVDVLLKHPEAEITCLTARFDKKTEYGDVYPRFKGRTDLYCDMLEVDEVSSKSDIIFLALPHRVSMDYAPKFLEKGRKVIDLSADYRLPAEVYQKWYQKEHADKDNIAKAVYGLPEINRKQIKDARLVANPGCYPTGIILALLPVIKDVLKKGSRVVIDSKSGTTGAGRKADLALSFSEVDENFKCYKANEHQHMPEIENTLSGYAGGQVEVSFVPHLLPVKRGILSTIYIEHEGLPPEKDIRKMYSEYFQDEPFVRIKAPGEMPELSDVAHTNYCDIGIKVVKGMLIIVSAIDNLLKGASGQAVQNMNIMSGLDEKAGLI
ncbi:MAG: N-acetyl-gamma-glutamyl-phosphate reductase [Candidatus Omnitrophica bacterium]|nr:N-acetyl-gamma-glutamyl-phosphate reductase [Candidatus Omnitrophota bacterium]